MGKAEKSVGAESEARVNAMTTTAINGPWGKTGIYYCFSLKGNPGYNGTIRAISASGAKVNKVGSI